MQRTGNPQATKTTITKRRRFRRKGIVIVIPTAILSSCVGSPKYYWEKLSGVGSPQPKAQPEVITPQLQIESHTCGFHSMSSIYLAYGLDPEALRLRFRIGVDKPLSPLWPDSRGTIHPDMLRVLKQDGFATDVILPNSTGDYERIERHLAQGHYGVALIDVGELHWVVLGAPEDVVQPAVGQAAVGQGSGEIAQAQIEVCDSLSEEKYLVPTDEYLSERVLNIILVKPM